MKKYIVLWKSSIKCSLLLEIQIYMKIIKLSNAEGRQLYYIIDLLCFFLDVPNPPGRPMVTGFTSRSMTLSWSKPRQTDAAPVLGYVITTG